MSTKKTKVITGPAMLSYPHLDKAQKAQKEGDKEKFTATFVFAPGADLRTLEAAALEAAEERFGSKAGAMLASGQLRSPFRKDATAKGYADGSTFINTRSDRQPGLVYLHAGPDGKSPAVIEQKDIVEVLYPGAQVRASVVAFAYDTGTNKGVSFALNNIQKLGDGARLDSRVAATEEFDADLNAAPADLSALAS